MKEKFKKLRFNHLSTIRDAQLNIARIANAVPCHSLFKGHKVNVNIVVLNCLNEISTSSVKSQVTSLWDCSLRAFSKCLDFSENLKFFQKSKIF